MQTSCTLLRTKTRTNGLAPTELGEHDAHDRQKRLWFWVQDKIARAKIGVVGCGGLGAEFLEDLARMGLGHLVFCDADIVQLSNLSKQPYFVRQKGENKALALLENLEEICTGETTLEAYSMDFQDMIEAFPDAFDNVDIIACLVDNEQTRYDTSLFGLKHGIPVIFSAVSDTSLNGYVFVQTNEGPCFNCISSKNDNDQERHQCIDPSVIYIHTAVMGVAVFIATWLIHGLDLPWNYYPINLDAESTPYLRKKNLKCNVCKGVS